MSTSKVYCPQCGAASEADASTCANGHKLPTVVRQPSQPAPQADPEKAKKGFSFVTFVFLLGLIPNPAWLITAPIGIALAVLSYKNGWGK